MDSGKQIKSYIFFLLKAQMSFRIGLLFLLLVVLAAALWFMPRDGFTTLNTSAPAPMIQPPPEMYPARNILPAGSASPVQAPPPDEVRVVPPEVANDPYEPNEESASMPERLRHPERMFKPAPSNTSSDISEASGIASESVSQAAQALQRFAPEMAQNGGEFMQGIFANDTTEQTNFSSF